VTAGRDGGVDLAAEKGAERRQQAMHTIEAEVDLPRVKR